MDDNWDFYPCRVDDAPGSISLNLALADHIEALPENTLYAIRIRMADGDTHGMGSSEEADLLWPVEDALVADLSAHGVRFIGRLRNLGFWQLTFMGSPGLEPDVERIARAHIQRAPREFSTFAKADPQWTYYSNFLFPTEERMRWIEDRRVVEALKRHGDPLTQRRRVDHWIYFRDQRSQAEFASSLREHGFDLQEPLGDALDFPVQTHRVDSVQLDEIHKVTNLLTDLAKRFNGDYDGWETSVETD